MLNVVMYALGWLLFLYMQCENSINSTTNGLPRSKWGRLKWLQINEVSILWRAFWCSVLQPSLVKYATDKIGPPLEAVGLTVAVWSFSAIAGFCSSVFLYQIFGMVPAFRGKEVADLVPPPLNLSPPN